MIVVKRLGGGGHVKQALVSFSLGNGLLCPETKLTHTQSDASSRGGGSLVSYVSILGNISKLEKNPGL
jgi:hypothetical protein